MTMIMNVNMFYNQCECSHFVLKLGQETHACKYARRDKRFCVCSLLTKIRAVIKLKI